MARLKERFEVEAVRPVLFVMGYAVPRKTSFRRMAFPGKSLRRTCASAESPNYQRVAARAVQTQHVHAGPALRGENQLANSQQRGSARHRQQLRRLQIRRGRVNFFVGVSEFHTVFVLESHKQRAALEGSAR